MLRNGTESNGNNQLAFVTGIRAVLTLGLDYRMTSSLQHGIWVTMILLDLYYGRLFKFVFLDIFCL